MQGAREQLALLIKTEAKRCFISSQQKTVYVFNLCWSKNKLYDMLIEQDYMLRLEI